MSFPLDQITSRTLARVQQHEQKRTDIEQMTIRAARTLPAGFRARVRRTDMAAAKRHDHHLLFSALLALALIVAGSLLNSAWNMVQRARKRKARLHANQPAAMVIEPNAEEIIEPDISRNAPVSPRIP